jgi:hypothetical protein
MLKILLKALENWWAKFSQKSKIEIVEFIPPPEPEPEPEPEPTMSDKLLKTAHSFLDKDVSEEILKKDIVPDEVACAETVSLLIKQIYKDFPILPSTRDLYNFFEKDKRFKPSVAGIGKIIISPRTPSTYGHVGIFITETRIASNDSRTGKFIGNYTMESWKKEFEAKRGLITRVYELL